MTDVVQSSVPYPGRIAPGRTANDARRRVFGIVGASSGNLVEWFDFYVYSFCAIYFALAFPPAATRLLNSPTHPGTLTCRMLRCASRKAPLLTLS